jgi:hypothetical protein
MTFDYTNDFKSIVYGKKNGYLVVCCKSLQKIAINQLRCTKSSLPYLMKSELIPKSEEPYIVHGYRLNFSPPALCL